MMKQVTTFVLCFTCWIHCHAQFSASDFLSSPTHSNEIKALESQLDFIQSNNFDSPILREVEIRLRTPDVQSSPDDFRLRLSPINPLERKANKEYKNVLKKQIEAEKIVTYSNIIARRYRIISGIYFLYEGLRNNQAQHALLKVLMEDLSSRLNTGEELIKVSKKMLDLKLEYEEIIEKSEILNYQVKQEYQIEQQIDLSNFELTSIDQIRQELNDVSYSIEQNAVLQNENFKLQLEKQDYLLNRRESFNNLGFLQAEYRSNRGDTFQEALGFQLGVTLPIVNPDRPELARRKLDVIEESFELETVKQDINDDLFRIETTLKGLLNQYSHVDSTLKTMQAISDSDLTINTAVELETYKIDLIEKRTGIHRQIIQVYIQWLENTGKLIETPKRNHLSRNKELLD